MQKYIAVMGIIVCALFTAGCPDNDENKKKSNHTDPSFLVGRWTRTATSDLPDFSINKDYSFECVVMMPMEPPAKAKVTGKLDHKVKNLGPNDYVIRNMVTLDDEHGTYTTGNNTLNKQLGGFNDLLATLAPNGDKTEFTFSASNQAAKVFFGGTYTKQ
jgi:hypothetical protein